MKMLALFYWLFICGLAWHGAMAANYESDPVIQLFQNYIQIDTTTGNDFTPGVEFWKALAAAENLPIDVYEFVEGYPVIVIKWAGTNSSLSSIMLNSHMDVVPAEEDDGWTYPPFSGHIDQNGDIYGRGTQDMKSISIQYYEALRRLKSKNVPLLRDVYMTLMPDEEVGAESGMIPFLQSEEFTALNVGFALDEGSSFPMPIIPIFYQDKVVWQIQVDCYGVATHGSLFSETNSTATGKCHNVVDRFLRFREEQYEISKYAEINDAGVYTSVNLNKLNGGTANNVVPSHVSLTFDIRLGTTVNENEFEAQLRQWVTEAGDNVTLTFILKNQQSPATLVDASNPYWVALYRGALSQNITILPTVPPGSTDARHVRNVGIPAFGFSPMPDTPLLAHAVDEHVNADVFLRGIGIYEQFIENLANIPEGAISDDPSVYIYATAV